VALSEPFTIQVKEYARIIRRLAKEIADNKNADQEIRRIARRRARRPIDYMRYAEFGAASAHLSLAPGSRILDAAGPQWLTLALAAKHSDVKFHYINLTDYELSPFERIRELLAVDNLVIQREDLRHLSFADKYFDEVLSISVLEHVYPETGGDDAALAELRRVIKNNGSIVATVPCKKEANVVYIQGNVFERLGSGKQFFAREYSPQTLAALISRTGFSCEALSYISEVPSLSSIDYLEWGPLRGTLQAKLLLRVYRVAARLLGLPIEEILALRKLSVSADENPRLVNALLHLRKPVSTS
jgi:SAM-dependent methyltransferase